MKKVFYLSSIILSLSFSAVLYGQTHRLVIKVISADRKEPIEGATIKIETKSDVLSERRFETSDWEGMAYREFAYAGTFTINAEASGYYGAIVVAVVKPKDPSGDVPVTLVLKRQAGVKLVVVDVFEKGTGALIYDAKVHLKGSTYSYNGTTNNSGNAIIAVDQGDDYVVTVSHNGYQSMTDNVRVKKYDDTQNEYDLSFELTPTKQFKRTMYVKVQTLAEDGNIWGVPFANVQFTSEGTKFEHNADEEGITEFAHSFPPLEQVRVDVKMGGYKPQSKTVTIKVTGVEGKGLGTLAGNNERDMVVFTLVKEKGLERTLVINVHDKAGKPIKYADLNFPDGMLKITDMYGKCEYTIKWPTDEAVKIEIEKKGFKPKTVNVSPGKNDLQVVLEKEQDEVDENWNGTFTDAYSQMILTGNGGVLSGLWTYAVSDSKGTGSLTNCKIDGNTVTGNWKAQHEDNTKTGTRSGTFAATLTGSTLSGQFVEDTPKWSYKTGYSDATVSSSMHKGAVWPFTFTRKK